MNSKIYRCGWCGIPTDEHGTNLTGNCFVKAVRIIETYGDYRTHKTHGECCIHEQTQRQRVTRDMAIDAGDLNLEGQWI